MAPEERAGPSVARAALSHSPWTASKAPPSIPGELFEKTKAWLDGQEMPFAVWLKPLSRKGKKQRRRVYQTQTAMPHPRLSTQYQVMPQAQWNVLKRFRRYTLAPVGTFHIGDSVLVKSKEVEEVDDDDKATDEEDVEETINKPLTVANDVNAKYWKALLLEVRALDQEHIYLRVAWLFRPEDLPTGRQPHHGVKELLLSNSMDIIDARTVEGLIEVTSLKDDDSINNAAEPSQYFWRQIYDFVTKRVYSV